MLFSITLITEIKTKTDQSTNLSINNMGEFKAPLPQGAGYAIVLGLGTVFAVGMILTTYMLRRYQKEI